MEHESHTPDASDQPGPPLPHPGEAADSAALADRRDLIAHHMAALEDLIDPDGRSDGWTPAARMGFLRLVSEHGRVSQACQCVGLSKQSAYSLRARDPLFAIGWDAACQMARLPLADSLYEQATDGLTDTITRDDGRIVTRHRIDTRLSIAVLNRLDRRCDKAAETGSRHLGAIAHWDEFVAAIGSDDPSAAHALLDDHALATAKEAETVNAKTLQAKTANLSQPSQLPLGDDDDIDDEDLPDPRIWWESGRKAYRTNFPPPEGQECFEQGQFGHRDYQRDLTKAEAALMAARDNARAAQRRAADEAERDAFFASVGEEEQDVPSPSAPPTPPPEEGEGLVCATDAKSAPPPVPDEAATSAGGDTIPPLKAPPKPAKSEPLPVRDRFDEGASKQPGES